MTAFLARYVEAMLTRESYATLTTVLPTENLSCGLTGARVPNAPILLQPLEPYIGLAS